MVTDFDQTWPVYIGLTNILDKFVKQLDVSTGYARTRYDKILSGRYLLKYYAHCDDIWTKDRDWKSNLYVHSLQPNISNTICKFAFWYIYNDYIVYSRKIWNYINRKFDRAFVNWKNILLHQHVSLYPDLRRLNFNLMFSNDSKNLKEYSRQAVFV